ncbi:putative TIR domain, P-loop containing nucleoside triphosphate hydrolase [Helianthus debilis subsp. tardiflorus]
MASTSTSSVRKSFSYDVFLSFRGEDTRKTFVDHLYHALVNKGIITYKDDEKIEKGKRVNDQLMRSIEDSRIYIIVFSENYASSSWCLNELVKIIECNKTDGRAAYPVFFNVEPTEVRHQSGAVKEAFAKHENNEAAGIWRDALKEAADLAGRELKTTFDGHEAKFIQKIVEDISLELRFIDSSVGGKFIGMVTRVKEVVSYLDIGSDDVHIIGIKGIGGGGKTTLARAVFDHISYSFEGKSFVENVREVSKGSGMKVLQEQILKDVLNDQSIGVTGVYKGINMMKKMMGSRKVLIVLDDVDDIEQLEALAGDRTWFKAGSTIIITTRDKHVLIAHRVKSIHDVNLLSHEEGIRLFSKYAFGEEIPIEGYEELSRKVVHYAAGLPLTIKVLGSSLCGKTEGEWNDAIERLKTIPEKKTLETLELSYIGLENDHKEIFLEVACILKGEPKDKAIRILESYGFHARIALKVLEQKSLIIVSDYGCLEMHDRIEEMGMNIVRRLHPREPQRHNRLWVKKEVEDILVNELGTEATLSIRLQYTELHPSIIRKGLTKMKKLRYLYVSGRDCFIERFIAYKPVKIGMGCSNISQQEGGERKVLNELKFLNIKHTEFRIFDLGLTPDLEWLDGCYDYEELHVPVESLKLKSLVLHSSILSKLDFRLTPQLETLNLEGCNNIEELHMPVESPKLKSFVLNHSKLSKLDLGQTPQLETLYLEGCNNLLELHMPVKCTKLKSLVLIGSKLSKLDLGGAPKLQTLDLEGCYDLVELHMPLECPKLKSLVLSDSKLGKLDLGLTPKLERLDLIGCYNFVFHMPVECPMLSYLVLSGYMLSIVGLELSPQLQTLHLEGYNHLVELHMPVECTKLKSMVLIGCKLSKLDLGLTPRLETLYLEGCNDLVELHMPVEGSKLKSLLISGSKLSKLNLGLTPQLERLDLENCYYLQEIHAPIGCLEKLVNLKLSGCSRFERFVGSHRHHLLEFGILATLVLIAESKDMCPLHPNNNLPKFEFKCFYGEPLPSSSGNLEKLLSFGLCACTNLESFSASICGLQRLRNLTLEGNLPEVPKDLCQLECLEKLKLSMKEIKHLPDSICMLKHLKSLDLKFCWLLQHLPMEICRLECLQELYLTDCISLQDIPNNICAGIGCLPQSIYQLKGLHIIGSRWRLESYGFTSLIEISTNTASCYIRDIQHVSPI